MSNNTENSGRPPVFNIEQHVDTVMNGSVIGVNIVNKYPSNPREKNLDVLLDKVKRFWVEGVLEKSLYNEVLIELDMVEHPDAVAHPWETTLELPGLSAQRIPKGRTIYSVFEDVGGSLLILGAPGSGKTISLLELARSLIEKAENDRSEHVPVVFNLSSWATQQLPLMDWMIQEFRIKYNVPQRFSKKWLAEHQLVILLDGLDEVRAERRTACVEAINTFLASFGAPGIVVCSRSAEYASLSEKFRFGGAIHIEALRSKQIKQFIRQAGIRLQALGKALETDTELQTLAQTPMMLSVMSLAYQDARIEELARVSFSEDTDRKTHLFNTYIHRMLNRRGKNPYSSEQVITWLSWLGKRMQEDSKTVFHVEELQMSWLKSLTFQLIYVMSSRMVGGSILGIFFGLFRWLSGDVIDGVTFGLFWGIIFGLAGCVIDSLKIASTNFSTVLKGLTKTIAVSVQKILQTFFGKFLSMKQEQVSSLIEALIYVLFGGVIGGILDGVIGEFPGFTTGATIGSTAGILWGLRSAYQSQNDDIRSVERLKWSRSSAINGGKSGITIGLILGPFLGFYLLPDRLQNPSLLDVVNEISGALILPGFYLGIFFGLIGVVLGGLTGTVVEGKNRVNQGIALSFKNAVIGMLIFGTIFGAIFGALFGLSEGPGFNLNEALMSGLTFFLIVGLIAFLWYGGQDVIQHYTLRLLLKRTSKIPLRLPRFLDYAAQLILLRKVGGGYIFIHRMLLDHFANKYEENCSAQRFKKK